MTSNILGIAKYAYFENDRGSYLIIQGRFYKYAFVNVHCPTLDSTDDISYAFYAE